MLTRRKKIFLALMILLALGVVGTVAYLFKDPWLEDRFIRPLSSDDEDTIRRAAERLVEMESVKALPALIRTIDYKGEFRGVV